MGTLNLTVTGFLKVYIDRSEYQSVIDITEWFLEIIRELRMEGKQNFWMRTESLFMAIQGDMFCRLQNEKKAVALLKGAKKLATKFDEKPYWGVENFRFIDIKEEWDVHDSLGETAIMAIESYLLEEASANTKKLWEKF